MPFDEMKEIVFNSPWVIKEMDLLVKKKMQNFEVPENSQARVNSLKVVNEQEARE